MCPNTHKTKKSSAGYEVPHDYDHDDQHEYERQKVLHPDDRFVNSRKVAHGNLLLGQDTGTGRKVPRQPLEESTRNSPDRFFRSSCTSSGATRILAPRISGDPLMPVVNRRSRRLFPILSY